MIKLIHKIEQTYNVTTLILDKYVSHILLFTLRLMIANIFWKSGLTKTGNIDSTILLFKYEYAVPLINPIFAAYSTTFFEIICSIMIAFGILTRISILPLIAITLVIQFFVLQHDQHFHWLIMMITVFTFGAGKICLGNILEIIAKILKTKNL